MPHIPRIQSITNQPSGGGNKKAGLVNTGEWPSIPFNILKSRTPKPFLFNASTGNSK